MASQIIHLVVRYTCLNIAVAYLRILTAKLSKSIHLAVRYTRSNISVAYLTILTKMHPPSAHSQPRPPKKKDNTPNKRG